MEMVKKNQQILRQLKEAKVIIIDEISMLKGNVIDSLNYVFRQLSPPHADFYPFDGRILVLCGDPFQLEPVCPPHEKSIASALESRSWDTCFGVHYGSGTVALLSSNQRERGDAAFFDVLSRVHLGRQTHEDLSVLNSTSREDAEPPKSHTCLVLHKHEASQINMSRMGNIPGPTIVISAIDEVNVSFEYDQARSTFYRRLNQAAPRVICTKVGARVLLTRKMQGLLPGTTLDIKNTSREMNTIKGKEEQVYSIHCSVATTSEFVSIGMVESAIHDYSGNKIGPRRQLPIISSYALTVHGVQSLTLEAVAMDFGKSMSRWAPHGSVYTALSRCEGIETLWVKGLSSAHISISPRAIKLMEKVECLRKEYPSRVICCYKTSILYQPRHQDLRGCDVEISTEPSMVPVTFKVITFQNEPYATSPIRLMLLLFMIVQAEKCLELLLNKSRICVEHKRSLTSFNQSLLVLYF